MYKAVYKCKLCGQEKTEDIIDSDFDIAQHKYPLCTLFKYHNCEDHNVGVLELVGIKKIGG
jgi:hypothetical protein